MKTTLKSQVNQPEPKIQDLLAKLEQSNQVILKTEAMRKQFEQERAENERMNSLVKDSKNILEAVEVKLSERLKDDLKAGIRDLKEAIESLAAKSKTGSSSEVDKVQYKALISNCALFKAIFK